MQNHTKKCMGVIRSRSESFRFAFDYNSVLGGKAVVWLEYGIVGMKFILGLLIDFDVIVF
jgi:hypothetical protein